MKLIFILHGVLYFYFPVSMASETTESISPMLIGVLRIERMAKSIGRSLMLPSKISSNSFIRFSPILGWVFIITHRVGLQTFSVVLVFNEQFAYLNFDGFGEFFNLNVSILLLYDMVLTQMFSKRGCAPWLWTWYGSLLKWRG